MIHFKKVLDVKSPVRGTKYSAGTDIYIPNLSKEFVTAFYENNRDLPYIINEESETITVPPHVAIKIPSGLQVKYNPENSVLVAHNKSGVSLNQKVNLLADTIDIDYTGQIFVTVHNYSDYPTNLVLGQKLIQILHMPIYMHDWEETSDLFREETERGSGGFGSTGLS